MGRVLLGPGQLGDEKRPIDLSLVRLMTSVRFSSPCYRRRTATASISICPPPGRSATARNVRAGKGWGRVAV